MSQKPAKPRRQRIRKRNINHKPSRTRSETLKGRPSNNTGRDGTPRQSKLAGLRPRPPVDPNLKRWPGDVVQIVASTQARVNVAGIRGRIVDETCADCQTRLAVDSHTIETALQLDCRNRRPLRFICVDCCMAYDRQSIEVLIDHRNTRGTNEGNELDAA